MSTEPFFRPNTHGSDWQAQTYGALYVGPTPWTSKGTKSFAKFGGMFVVAIPPFILGPLAYGGVPRADWITALLIASWVPAIFLPSYTAYKTYNSENKRFQNCSRLSFYLSVTSVVSAVASSIFFALIELDQTTTTSSF